MPEEADCVLGLSQGGWAAVATRRGSFEGTMMLIDEDWTVSAWRLRLSGAHCNTALLPSNGSVSFDASSAGDTLLGWSAMAFWVVRQQH